MSDKLEKFIRDNKQDFDEFEAPANLWSRIEERLDEEQSRVKAPVQPRVIRVSTLLRAAAVLVVILSAGILLWQYEKDQTNDFSRIDPKLAKEQMHYASLIEQKQSELKQIQKEDPQLYNEFSAEIGRMNETYQKLKADLPNSPNQEETVKAMIQNLQIQIEVLNQQLKVIDQINQYKKQQQHDTQSI